MVGRHTARLLAKGITMEAIPGKVYYWTRNHYDHPDDPDYNYFLVLDTTWGIRVRYLLDGKETTYFDETFRANAEYIREL